MRNKLGIVITVLSFISSVLYSDVTNIQFTHITNEEGLSYNNVTQILQDSRGFLWLGTWNGLTIMQKDSEILKTHFSQPANAEKFEFRKISVIFKDNSNNLWVGLNGKGLVKFECNKADFTDYLASDNPNSISDGYVTAVYKNKTNRLWVGTQSGISKFFQPENNFNYIQENKDQPSRGLNNSSVMTAYIDKDDNIWVGTLGGLNEIKCNPEDGREVVHFKNDPKNSNSLCDNFIRSVSVDNTGTVWIGTNNDGLNRYNPRTKFKLYTYDINDTNSISNKGVLSICEDRYGYLRFGTWWGLNRFDRKIEKFKRFLPDISNPDGLRNNVVWDIYSDTRCMLWIETDGGGVSEIDSKTYKFKNFSNSSGEKNYINSNRVFTIFEFRDGFMWFGTIDGLNCYNRETGKTIVYKKDDGLPDNLINGMKEDEKGYIWIATGKRLSKLKSGTSEFINYNKRNRIGNLEFVQNIAVKSKDGTLYLGSNGIMYFNPNNIKDDYLTSPIVFTDLRWNNVGTRNNATHTNLPPGEYTFIVKGTINNQKMNEEKASLKITIVPVFYQTLWFKSVLVIIIIFITIVIVQLKIRSIKKQNKILETKVADRTKDLDKTIRELSQEINVRKKAEATVQYSLEEKGKLLEEKEVLLKEIHHRVKNNLQVISSLLYLNSKKSKDPETLNMFKDSQNRVKSIALVHERLYQSKDLGKIDFKEYVQRLTKDLLRSYAVDQAQIQLSIDINNLFINIDLAVPCGLIINELVSNSLKYAFPKLTENNNGGIIKIEFNENGNNELLMIVSDNGVGMPEGLNDRKKLSLGLQLVDTLVSQLDGSLEIDSQNGTAFKIKFPNFKN